MAPIDHRPWPATTPSPLPQDVNPRTPLQASGHGLVTPAPTPGSGGGFGPIVEHPARAPHRFRTTAFRAEHRQSWDAIVGQCVQAWRLTSQTFMRQLERGAETGFSIDGLRALLTPLGAAELPETPPDTPEAMRAPAITDVSEVIAVAGYLHAHPGHTVPWARVLHKPVVDEQHRGIDALAYQLQDGEALLALVEVMASDDASRPPSTAYDHANQLVGGTITEDRRSRLLRDLKVVHGEAEAMHKMPLNMFIAAVLAPEWPSNLQVVGAPCLVRGRVRLEPADWRPFEGAISRVEAAPIKATIDFLGIQLPFGFIELLDRIKSSASSQGSPSGAPGGPAA